jgi:murein DD-endopeptidase MepM/ murein hydrolase activator NlpD
MKNLKTLAALGLFFLLTLIASCGGGTDPLKAFSDPNAIPVFTLPVPAPTVGYIFTLTTPSASPTPATFTNTIGLGIVSQIQVTAPAAGVVTNVDTTSLPGTTLTFYHTPQISSQVENLVSTALRIGDVVNQGDVIGVSATSPAGVFTYVGVYFSIFLNGQAVCPLSYLDTTSVRQINALMSIAHSDRTILCNE